MKALNLTSCHSTAQVRQDQINELILQTGQIKATKIAKLLNISIATVRRDLETLERRGLIDRDWGGAKVHLPIAYPNTFLQSAERNKHEKRTIAAAAAKHVADGMVIGLSGGTTCVELARWLRGRRITVVTNAINVATELYNHSHTKIIVTGGTINSYSFELIGDMVAHSLQEYRLDLSFLGCSGITSHFGVCVRDTFEATGAKAFVQISNRAIILADHTKAGKQTFARLAPTSAFERLITDTNLSVEWQGTLETSGLHVEIAPKIPVNQP